MKKFRFIFVLFIISVSLSLFGKEQKLTIIHTNDLHSHMLGFSPNIDYTPQITGDDATLGGWARIMTVIKKIKRERKNPVLLLDAGDFLMGSLFHMISREEAIELRLMKEMGFDVTTLGNHEFDLMPKGLARILKAGHRNGGLIKIISSNVIFSKESDKDDTLEEIFKMGLVKPYTVLERGGKRIGIFGLVGKDAAEVAPFAKPLKFGDIVKTGKKMVDILKNKEKVDIVICLSHSGLWEDKSKSEDEILAQEAPGIDIIISGHTHTKLPSPILINDTMIVQAWEYGKQVGIIDIIFKNGGVKLEDYKIIDINDGIAGDTRISKLITGFKEEINRKVLKAHGLRFDSIIAHTGFDLVKADEETNLGNLIADSSRWYVNKYDYDPGDPKTRVMVAIDSNGLIRDNVLAGKTGNIAVSDLFRALPLGIGMDDTMAYPLITVYLYASEIKKAMEILTSIYPPKGTDYFLQVSGIKLKYNPNRMIFDRITDIQIGSEEDGYKRLDYSSSNKELYRVTANIYNATFLKIIGGFTMDILKIVPKERNGKPIDDLDDARVDADKNRPGIQELKQWVGLMEYVKNFKDIDGDGIADVPEKYRGKLGRIVKEASWNPVSLLKGGNYLTWIGFSGIIIVLSIFFLIIRTIMRKIKI